MDSDHHKRTTNYSCIAELLDRGNKHLHRIFLEKWAIYHKLNTKNINEWKNDANSGKELLSLCNNSATKKQKILITDGNIHVWDISVTFLAIQNVSKEIMKNGGKIDTNEEASIKAIKDQRNKHAHQNYSVYESADDEFQKDWKNLSNTLIQLGENSEDITAIKVKHFEPESTKTEPESEFEELKNKLNKLIEDKKYYQAHGMNDEMLRLPNLSAENTAFIYAKRSEIFLILDTEENYNFDNFERAKIFAQIAIENFPTWGEGYFRLAKAQIKCNEFKWAAKNLEVAVKLDRETIGGKDDPDSNQFQDELTYVQREIASLSYMKKKIERKSREYEEKIYEANKNGSDTANRVISIWWWLDCATDALKNNNRDMFIYFLSKAVRLDFDLVIKDVDIFKPIVNEYIEGHETDIDAVTCYTKFNWGKWGFENIIVNFAKTNYMDTESIAAMVPIQIHLYGQKEEALTNVEKMLIDAPNSLRLLYYRVFALCEQKVLSPKIVSAIDDFLKIAPDDHEKVPECIYRKAIYYSLNSNYELFSKYFLAAQEAEKKQLPCFLPYKCRDKSLAEKLYSNLIKGTMDNLPKLLPLTSSKQNLIIQHRKSFIDAESINSKKSAFLKPKQIPSKRPEFVTPKLISLREMGSAENSFYGRMLNAKVIDWPFLSKSNLFVVIEDDNGDVQRLAIRNWPLKGNNSKTRADAMKTLSPHCTILILYPQLQRMNDMDIMVSVESMLYIKTVNDEFNDKRCFVCGKATKVLKCSKCLLSHYCSKDCQKIDWIGLKHKDVCDLLKKYGEKIITS